MPKKSIYFDISRADSYNSLITILMGGRGIGKTYQVKKRIVNEYQKTKKHFLYVRRYDDELKVCPDLFTDINRDFGTNIEYKRGHFFCDGEEFGQTVSLSKAQNLKGVSLPQVWCIFYDEFCLEKPTSRYLENEPMILLSLYQTINRDREIRGEKPLKVYMCSNFTTENNPFFMDWDISFNEAGECVKKDKLGRVFLTAHSLESLDFQNAQESLASTHMIEALDKSYADYAIRNKSLKDNLDFIRNIWTPSSIYVATLEAGGILFSVWSESSRLFIQRGHVIAGNPILSLSKDFKEGNISIKAELVRDLKNKLREYNNMGYILYDTIRTKNLIREEMKKAGI